MTREEAIEMLHAQLECLTRRISGCDELCDECSLNYEQGNMGEHRECLRMAIKALEQRWIPVSEKLPEEDGCYLVTTTGTNNDIIDIAYYTEDIWHKASRIKAWMPLPEPY